MKYPNSKLFLKSLHYIFNRFILNKRYMIGISEKYNLKFKFKTQDSVGRNIFKKGLYEEDLTNYLINTLNFNKGDIFFDVGANLGWYSNIIPKYFPKVEVHSFEPDPENFKILTHNLKLNNINNVNLNNMGLGEKNETIKLYLYKNSNQGRHSMLKINEGPTIDVKITSFDEYIKNKCIDVSKIKFIKIDIEGFEYSAFLGATELLKNSPFILAEYSPDFMRKGNIEPEKLLNLMYANNYIPFTINELDIKPISKEALISRNSNINLIWKKSI